MRRTGHKTATEARQEMVRCGCDQLCTPPGLGMELWISPRRQVFAIQIAGRRRRIVDVTDLDEVQHHFGGYLSRRRRRGSRKARKRGDTQTPGNGSDSSGRGQLSMDL